MKKAFLVLRAGLQETVSDKKNILLLLLIGFVLDNGVRVMVSHAQEVGQPLGIFEGFLLCVNHWYFLIIYLIGFVFILTGVPKLDSSQILLIYRAGRKGWLLGEIMQLAVSAFLYILLLLAGCMACTAKYAYVGNVWSNFTVNYMRDYKELLTDNNRYIDQQVFRYYLPYQALFHGVVLLLLCMLLMGTLTIYLSIFDKKLLAILLNAALILLVVVFNEYHVPVMWLSPFCHAVLALHNTYIYRELSVPLWTSYLYLIGLETLMIYLSMRGLKKKMFY